MIEEYFKGCTTARDRKIRLRELAKQHHPDVGGSEAIMKEITSQFRGDSPRTVNTESHKSDATGYGYRRAYGFTNGFSGDSNAQKARQQEAQAHINKRAEELRKQREKKAQEEKEAEEIRKAEEAAKKSPYGSFFEAIFGDGGFNQYRNDNAQNDFNENMARMQDREIKLSHIPEPCPFCNGILIGWVEHAYLDEGRAVCGTCGAEGPTQKRIDTSYHGWGRFYKWNRRPQ